MLMPAPPWRQSRLQRLKKSDQLYRTVRKACSWAQLLWHYQLSLFAVISVPSTSAHSSHHTGHRLSSDIHSQHSWLPTHPSHLALPSFDRRLAICSAKNTNHSIAGGGLRHYSLLCSCRSHLWCESPGTPGEPLPFLQGKAKPPERSQNQVWV